MAKKDTSISDKYFELADYAKDFAVRLEEKYFEGLKAGESQTQAVFSAGVDSGIYILVKQYGDNLTYSIKSKNELKKEFGSTFTDEMIDNIAKEWGDIAGQLADDLFEWQSDIFGNAKVEATYNKETQTTKITETIDNEKIVYRIDKNNNLKAEYKIDLTTGNIEFLDEVVVETPEPTVLDPIEVIANKYEYDDLTIYGDQNNPNKIAFTDENGDYQVWEKDNEGNFVQTNKVDYSGTLNTAINQIGSLIIMNNQDFSNVEKIVVSTSVATIADFATYKTKRKIL